MPKYKYKLRVRDVPKIWKKLKGIWRLYLEYWIPYKTLVFSCLKIWKGQSWGNSTIYYNLNLFFGGNWVKVMRVLENFGVI